MTVTWLTFSDPPGAQASAVVWLIVLRALACHVVRMCIGRRRR